MSSHADSIDFDVLGTKFTFHDPTGTFYAERFLGPIFEPSLTTFLSTLLKTWNGCFLDIGAHYGYFTTFVGKLNPHCEIHAFEPGPDHREILRRNVERNHVNATIHGVALSDETASVPFSDRTMYVQDDMNATMVDAVTFDAFNREHRIRPDVIKIDVHGAEGKVLHGMKETLASSSPHVFVEIHDQPRMVPRYSYAEILSVLQEADFLLYELLDFRRDLTPHLRLLEGDALKSVTDFAQWTEDNVSYERMIYACKRHMR